MKIESQLRNPNKYRDLFLLLSCMGLFAVAASVRLISGDFPLDELLTGKDDWNKYAQQSVDILHKGWTMPSLNENYVIPAGFLYNYFVAGCMLVSVEQPGFVYLVQAVLLGITVYMAFVMFRDEMKRVPQALLLGCLLFFAFFDIFKYYTFRLLSENLALFLVMGFFYFSWKSKDGNSIMSDIFRGLFLAAITLTRPNLLPCMLWLLTLFLFFRLVKDKLPVNAFFLIAGVVALYLMFPLRNYLVTGDFALIPADRSFAAYIARYNIHSWQANPLLFVGYLLKKLFFVFGFMPGIEPSFLYRPHWMIMWAGFFIYVVTQFRTIWHDRFRFMLISFIFCFVIIQVLITQIHNYGFRMILPGVLLVLPLAIKGFDILIDRWQSRRRT